MAKVPKQRPQKAAQNLETTAHIVTESQDAMDLSQPEHVAEPGTSLSKEYILQMLKLSLYADCESSRSCSLPARKEEEEEETEEGEE